MAHAKPEVWIKIKKKCTKVVICENKCIFANLKIFNNKHNILINNNYHKPTGHSHRHSASGANQVAHILLLVLAMLLPATLYASPWNARDYFRDGSNFDAYSMGQGRIHFKNLVFAEGYYYNNNAGTGGHSSRIWTHLDGTNNWENFIYYASDNHICKPGQVDGRPEDKGWASIRVTEGVVVVTNAYAGDNPVFMADNEWHNVDLKRTTSGDHLTYLEFDWYPRHRDCKSSRFIRVLRRSTTKVTGRPMRSASTCWAYSVAAAATSSPS